ncbi:uncharacterized protein LOC131954746 [Physella acuta]|uniref:uncharacterized protein LOC131954746 n=1 Tax=Physella acuta TaxID=109671 RepID=UPI0027DD0F98|nr:uncharacterized protein LOC131954746 [Physella acuta]
MSTTHGIKISGTSMAPKVTNENSKTIADRRVGEKHKYPSTHRPHVSRVVSGTSTTGVDASGSTNTCIPSCLTVKIKTDTCRYIDDIKQCERRMLETCKDKQKLEQLIRYFNLVYKNCADPCDSNCLDAQIKENPCGNFSAVLLCKKNLIEKCKEEKTVASLKDFYETLETKCANSSYAKYACSRELSTCYPADLANKNTTILCSKLEEIKNCVRKVKQNYCKPGNPDHEAVFREIEKLFGPNTCSGSTSPKTSFLMIFTLITFVLVHKL